MTAVDSGASHSTTSLPGVAPLLFNLWSEPWIGVTRPDGSVEEVGISDCLERAHELATFYDVSPLVVAGLHRLLAAVAQAMYGPSSVAEIADILVTGRFEPLRIAELGDRYAHRFDLFSPDAPFLQSADVPAVRDKSGDRKTIGYLMAEEPSGTAVVHFRHRYDQEHHLCPPCAARGLITLPAFATSGGAGIKPSINGVPPLYVLPVGASLFETLALSLVAPAYQPAAADTENCSPIWAGKTTIVRGAEVNCVDYLQSLTFPARRVRLSPQRREGECTRCGCLGEVLVSDMVFEMGHSRPKDAPAWLDPFAAYTLRGEKSPVPVRPCEGKALWREYATLFLTAAGGEKHTLRPAIVNQIYDLEEYGYVESTRRLTFRCIGMRTDMKAKVFEWTDDAIEVPVGLLADGRGARMVRLALEHAEECARDLTGIFSRVFRPAPGSKRERYHTLRERMESTYWTLLATPFREFVLAPPDPSAQQTAERQWVEAVLRTGREVFEGAVEGVGERGADLRQRVQAVQLCSVRLARRRKEWLDE